MCDRFTCLHVNSTDSEYTVSLNKYFARISAYDQQYGLI